MDPLQYPIDSLPTVNPLTADRETAKVTELPPLSKVGYNLSKFILLMISGYIIFLIIYLLINNVDSSKQITSIPNPNLSDSAFNRQLQVFKLMQEEHKNNRDLITQISQMILLNLLLPTLTAILGYIFGSREESKK